MTLVPKTAMALPSYMSDLLSGGKTLSNYFLGFDEQVGRMNSHQNGTNRNAPAYPPYNIKAVGDNKYSVEMALAGFKIEEIEVSVDGDMLVISGATAVAEDAESFVYRGIAARNFTRAFVLHENMRVLSAEMADGILTVALEKVIPEGKAAKKIEIIRKSEPQFLAE